MASIAQSWANGNVPANWTLPSTGFPIALVTVYNNTPAQIAITEYPPSGGTFPYGGIVVPAFYPIGVPVPSWNSIAYTTDGTPMFAGSSLLIVIQDSPQFQGPLSPFGPSGWGAGSDPSTLTQINPGDQILAWQIRQFYNALTGVIPIGSLAVGTGILQLDDGDSIGGDYWQIIASGGLLKFFSSVFGSDLLRIQENGLVLALQSLDVDGTLGLSGRITAPFVGASVSPLYHPVFISPQVTSLAGSGTVARTAFTVSGLPASAVAVMGMVIWDGTTAGDHVAIFANTSDSHGIGEATTEVGLTNADSFAFGACTSGASNQLYYVTSVSGAGSWTLAFVLTGYYELT